MENRLAKEIESTYENCILRLKNIVFAFKKVHLIFIFKN